MPVKTGPGASVSTGSARSATPPGIPAQIAVSLVLLDPDSRVLWTLELPFHHDIAELPDGHMLIFDNGADRGYSRVLEIDPRTKEIV